MSAGLTRRGVLAACGGLGLAACGHVPPMPLAAGPAAGRVTLVGQDWHTDIALAASCLEGRLARLAAGTWPGARHLVVGFGERAWLTSPNRSLADMVSALFPGPGAMLVTGLAARPAEAFAAEAAIAFPVDAAGLGGLLGFLEASFAWDAAGDPLPLAEAPPAGARFFASDLTYSARYTCNTWTAEGLMRAGLPVNPEGALFAGQVMARGRAAARALALASAPSDASGRPPWLGAAGPDGCRRS